MGDLIQLADWQAARTQRPSARRPTFYFDLACPFSYIAAERVERELGEVYWIPATGLSEADRDPGGLGESERAAAERLARAHRLPLIWREGACAPTPMAMRAAQYATELGAGAAFALAAGRLAYCGGFPLERLETLAEAAAAAGLEQAAVLAAAGDTWRDAGLAATGRGLHRQGAGALPAIRFGRVLVHGAGALERAGWLHREGLPNRAPAG